MFMLLRVTADRSLRLTIQSHASRELLLPQVQVPLLYFEDPQFSFEGGVPLFLNLPGI